MNEVDAVEVAEARLRELRGLGYARLVGQWLHRPRSEYAIAPSGQRYQLEIEAVWDRDFIARPDGSFVGDQVPLRGGTSCRLTSCAVLDWAA